MVASQALRVVFFGTPDFAVPTLEALLASRHTVIGVVTQPDRPRGRGKKLSQPPVKELALGAGVPVVQPVTLKDQAFQTAFATLRADIGVVAAYGKILPSLLIDTPRLGMVNVHASLLPRHRGAAPVHRAVLAGDTETGVTIMRVVAALDAGPMIASERRIIEPDETSLEVERDLARIGARLLVATLEPIAAGTAEERPQDERAATYAPRLTKQDGQIDWSRPARAIHNQIRGLHPWPLAYTYVNGQRLILRRSSLSSTGSSADPGTVLTAHADNLIVTTGEGALRLLELQLEGGRAMIARDFLAGHRLEPGMRLSSGR